MAADDELDDILDSALTEFGQTSGLAEVSAATVLAEAATASQKAGAALSAKTHKQETAEAVASVMENLDSDDFRNNLMATLKHLSDGGDAPDGTNPFNGSGVGANALGEMDSDIAKTMQSLSEITSKQTPSMGLEAAAMEGAGEDVMKQMMADFEKMAEKKDFGGLMDGLMKQLMSKDIMYEPVKAICDKYPEWLAENEAKIPKDDYTSYGKQYQVMQRICAVFETEPDNYDRLVQLMTQMQDLGQPPAEIVKSLAPGLSFSDDGVPQMADMGPGLAQMLGGAPGGAGGEQCAIM